MNRRMFAGALFGSTAFAQPPQQATGVKEPDLEWHEAKTSLTVEGLGFRDLKSPYDRLPIRAEGVVRGAVWNLSRDSAGAVVRFTTDSKEIRARWTLTNKRLSGPNMTPIAASGLDLYVKTGPSKWRWLGVGRPTQVPTNTDTLASGLPAGSRDYLLYLPMYNGVTSVEVGVLKGAAISKTVAGRRGARPIVFYGTSITQGASASRPGMTHVAMLGRWFDREVINLGFSGNGKMEAEVTKFLVEIDADVFVLDCLPNMTAKDIQDNAEKCVRMIRVAHPKTPILLVEDRNFANGFLNASRRERNETNHKAMQEVFDKMKQDRVAGLHYLKADDLLAEDGEDTIDGSHPTDLGFLRQAREFEKALRKTGVR
jgi:hypothetical protein